jgi:hypothetical protein
MKYLILLLLVLSGCKAVDDSVSMEVVMENNAFEARKLARQHPNIAQAYLILIEGREVPRMNADELLFIRQMHRQFEKDGAIPTHFYLK